MHKPPIQKSKQDDFVRTALRLPPDLHKAIKAAGDLNGWGMNVEILIRLRASTLEAKVDHLAQQNAELKAMLREILDAVE